jgi:hypothetical protein
MLLAQSSSESDAGGLAIAFITVMLCLYLIPSVVAIIRKVPNIGSVIVINVFLGWSIIGWVVALAMAARSTPPVHQVIVHQHEAPPVPAKDTPPPTDTPPPPPV